MKKLIVAASIVLTALVTNADASWSWWMENKDSTTDVAFGLASKYAAVESLELSLLYGGSPVSNGVQWSLVGINDSDANCPLQLSFWFNRGQDPCVQLGCINVTKSINCGLGIFNISNDAKFQLGLLNINKKGFLPIFPIVNFDPAIFRW